MESNIFFGTGFLQFSTELDALINTSDCHRTLLDLQFLNLEDILHLLYGQQTTANGYSLFILIPTPPENFWSLGKGQHLAG